MKYTRQHSVNVMAEKSNKKKYWLQKKGQSLIEIIIALAIFALIGAAMVALVVGSFQALEKGGEQFQAAVLAQEGIEAVRSIRDRGWNELSYQQSGITINSGRWEFLGEGTSEVIGRYQRTITFVDIYRDANYNIVLSTNPGAVLDLNSQEVRVEVQWTPQPGIVNIVRRYSLLTNWAGTDISQCLTLDWTNACFDSQNNYKRLLGLTLTNSCDEAIAISGTIPGWNIPRKIELVEIDNLVRWSWNCDWNCSPRGRQNSGATLDFGDNDLFIASGSTVAINRYEWNASMSGALVSVSFLFEGGISSLPESFSPPDCAIGEGETCVSYCRSLGYGTGNCEKNEAQCRKAGGKYEPAGNLYCPVSANTCCCF